HTPYLSISHHGYSDALADVRNIFPVGWWFVAVRLRACMDGKLIGSCIGHGLGILQIAAAIFIAQADLGRYRDIGGHGIATCFNNMVDALRLAQQAGAAIALIDRLRRTAEVQINGFCAGLHRFHRIDGHGFRLAPQQLKLYRGTTWRKAMALNLRGKTEKYLIGQGLFGYPDKFGDAAVESTDVREQGSDVVIDYPLHRGQHNSHG